MTTAQTDVGQEPVEVDKPDADDMTLWSVTTIIGALDKPALLYWAAQQAANAAIDSSDTWQAMVKESGRDEAAKWLRDARFRKPKNILSPADLGADDDLWPGGDGAGARERLRPGARQGDDALDGQRGLGRRAGGLGLGQGGA